MGAEISPGATQLAVMAYASPAPVSSSCCRSRAWRRCRPPIRPVAGIRARSCDHPAGGVLVDRKRPCDCPVMARAPHLRPRRLRLRAWPGRPALRERRSHRSPFDGGLGPANRANRWRSRPFWRPRRRTRRGTGSGSSLDRPSATRWPSATTRTGRKPPRLGPASRVAAGRRPRHVGGAAS